MDKEKYEGKVCSLLDDNTYEVLEQDPTVSFKHKRNKKGKRFDSAKTVYMTDYVQQGV